MIAGVVTLRTIAETCARASSESLVEAKGGGGGFGTALGATGGAASVVTLP